MILLKSKTEESVQMLLCLCVVQDPKGSEVIWVRDCEEVVRLDGLTEVEVNSAQDLLQMHRRGSALRHTGKSQ